MDHSAGLHGKIVVLLLILHNVSRSYQESVETSTPIHLEVFPDPHQEQSLIVEWRFRERVYPSGVSVMFHIQVARSRRKNIVYNEFYNTSVSGSDLPFSWLWGSDLPLECDSHFFRIRYALLQDSFASEQDWSAWSHWKTHSGRNRESLQKPVIYPHEKIVLEGSDVSFCCLPGLSDNVKEMIFKRDLYPNQAEQMKTDSYVITVKNVSMTRSDGDNVICRVYPMGSGRPYGTVLIVSRPPSEPQNFSCESDDLQKLHCSWTPGPLYNFYGHLAEKYTLKEWSSGKVASCSRENCTWHIVRNQQIYNFTLNVQNRLGEKSIHAIVDAAQSVRPVVPTALMPLNVKVTDAVIIWTLKADYSSLVLQCQTDLKERAVNVTLKGKPSTERYSISLTQLRPYTKYEVRMRCMAESSLAGWSDWSDSLIIQTQEAAPSAPLNVWREIQQNQHVRTVTLYWKHPPGFSANGKISHYNIKWWPLGDNLNVNKAIVSAQSNSYNVNLGGQAHVICITAQNEVGVSPGAEIKVPGTSGNVNKEVEPERTHGRDGGISVMWTPVPEVQGFVVEWCDSPRSPYCDLQWKKYNSTTHRDIIYSASFLRGVRYSFQIYGSKEDGEHLLEKLTGYTKELVSSKNPKVVTTKINADSLTLDWSPYPIDETQEGFVMGYTIYVKTSGSNCELEASNGHIMLDGLEVCRFLIEDPKVMNTTIRQLKPNMDYEVAVVAVTGGGETTREFNKASTPSDARAMVMSILLPGVLLSVLVVILLIAAFLNRTWLKESFYPKIPKPNKSKALSFTSPHKGPGCISVPPDVGSVSQKVERVYVLEKAKAGQDLKDYGDQQTEVLYSSIQKPTNTISAETSVNIYFPENMEQGSPDNQTELLYKAQSPTYLEFFNENYTATSDDLYEENLGYRPQMGSTQLNQSSGQDPSCSPSQNADMEFVHQLRHLTSEPVSPTSVNSTSFILKD